MPEYIEREAAIKELNNDAPEQVGYSREDAADCIRYIPAADVAPVVHGRWRWCGADRWNDAFECSVCGKLAMDDSNFCPYCGAKMDLGGDENNG